MQVGDYVMYGSIGICSIEEIGEVHMAGTPKGKVYYTLLPVNAKGSRIFIPVDNQKVRLRPIVSIEEAENLLVELVSLEVITPFDDKKNENQMKEIIRSCSCKETARLLKTLYYSREVRLKTGKKLSAGADKYFTLSLEALTGELAIVWNIKRAEVEKLLMEELEQSINIL